MSIFDWAEFLSYVVTIFGLPVAIFVFWFEQRKERIADQEEINQRLGDEYTDFLKLVLSNADLQLLRRKSIETQLSDEQKERRLALFGILISLFERAYIVIYEEKMDKQTRRLWLTWDDFVREWCIRDDFIEALPTLLEGEDPEFQEYMMSIAREFKKGEISTAHSS
jgi:hypothetical protein